VDFQAVNVEDFKILIVQVQDHVIVATVNTVTITVVVPVVLFRYTRVVVGLDGVVVQLQLVKSQANPVLVEDTLEYMAEVA
jgi:hypothetical protein